MKNSIILFALTLFTFGPSFALANWSEAYCAPDLEAMRGMRGYLSGTKGCADQKVCTVYARCLYVDQASLSNYGDLAKEATEVIATRMDPQELIRKSQIMPAMQNCMAEDGHCPEFAKCWDSDHALTRELDTTQSQGQPFIPGVTTTNYQPPSAKTAPGVIVEPSAAQPVPSGSPGTSKAPVIVAPPTASGTSI